MSEASPKTHAINIGDLGRTQMEDTEEVAIRVENLDLYYGESQALKSVSMNLPKNRVTAFIGPSGCGKSTLLRCFNRMNDLVEICRVDGKILMEGKNIYDRDVNVALLRRRVGMVFQKPNPFPKSIYENVAYGLRIMGVNNKSTLDEAVEKALRGAALWNEVKDRLDENGLSLSGGQQQRLVIARAIAL
jgi:phosphate transport system ATP-binding protein